MSEVRKIGDVNLLVATVSWENRFLLGLKRLLGERRVGRVHLLHFRELKDWTEEARDQAIRLCAEHGVTVESTALSYEAPEETWQGLRRSLASDNVRGSSVLVDISTMPRETIWSVFFFLRTAGASIAYAYHRPDTYGKWLTRDPGKPRLLIQMSGEALFGRDTVLATTTGFDTERTGQLVHAFAPTVALLGMQVGAQFDNPVLNIGPHTALLSDNGSSGGPRIRQFDVDAYVGDHGRAEIERQIAPHLKRSNLILSSLGPKLSAVAVFEVHCLHPETALAYAPSKEFNREYSQGIGTTCYGTLATC